MLSVVVPKGHGAIFNVAGEVFLMGPVDQGLSTWVNDEEPDQPLVDLVGHLWHQTCPEEQVVMGPAGEVRVQVWSGPAVHEAMRDVLRWLGGGGHAVLAAERQEQRHQGAYRASTFLHDPEVFRQFALFLGRSASVGVV